MGKIFNFSYISYVKHDPPAQWVAYYRTVSFIAPQMIGCASSWPDHRVPFFVVPILLSSACCAE